MIHGATPHALFIIAALALASALGGCGASKPATATAEQDAAEAEAGTPAKLTRGQVERGLQPVRAAVRACGKGASGHLTLKITIGGDGKVVAAEAVGKLAGTPVGACAAEAVTGAVFAEFEAAEMVVTLPFEI